MPVQVTTIMIGVEDLARSKTFYREGLGCKIPSCVAKQVTRPIRNREAPAPEPHVA
jgi:extradiol dioxygenase family protein